MEFAKGMVLILSPSDSIYRSPYRHDTMDRRPQLQNWGSSNVNFSSRNSVIPNPNQRPHLTRACDDSNFGWLLHGTTRVEGDIYSPGEGGNDADGADPLE
jgi:hypothetical protein